MIEIQHDTPFIAESMPMPWPTGGQRLLLICKASFSWQGGEIKPLDAQIPLLYGDESGPGQTVLLEADNAPLKTQGDLIVVGKAYVPKGRKTGFLDVQVRTKAINHIVRVYGKRQWVVSGMFSKLKPARPEPFTEMDLGFHLAFGGQDSQSGEVFEANPLGKGFISNSSKNQVEGVELPNLENPRQLIERWDDRPLPCCLGIMPKGGQPRVRDLGDFKDHKDTSRYPPDFKFSFFNGAIAAMRQKGYFSPGEQVQLIHLSPTGMERFALPRIKPVFGVTSGDRQTVVPALDTLVVYPDKQQFACVWRGSLEVANLSCDEVERIELVMEEV